MRRRGKLGPISMTATPVDRRSKVPGLSDIPARAWFRISNAGVGAVDNSSTRVDIYEEIGGWGVSAAEFVEALRAVTTPAIDLHINSPGGSVFDGVAIYNALSQHPATVHAYVDGLAASAASFIAQAADEITMNPGSMMMVHDAIGMTWGNALDHTTMAALLAQVSDSIADLYAARAGGDAASWRAVMENNGGEGKWYTAREAVEAGLADRVAGDPEPDDSVADDEDTQDATAPTSDDPREAYDSSTLAAGHRLVAHYREQVAALAPPAPRVRPAADALLDEQAFAVFAEAWRQESTGNTTVLAPDWATPSTSSGDVPLANW